MLEELLIFPSADVRCPSWIGEVGRGIAMVLVMVTMEELLILSSADEVSVIGVLGRGTVMVLVMVTMVLNGAGRFAHLLLC